ncbi:hypothetical protein SK128_005240 [Halocaridina rubra]|uniref:Uncharacterized protein n=1 Tax=Halocaridina rubra TaxID=373956 RepID=A0AAN8WRM6_HALRR
MDDGETPLETLVSYHNITFEADASSLTVTVVEEDCSDINFSTEITSVRVFGIEPISQVTIDGTEHLYYTQEQDNHALNIFNITYDWCEQTNLIIRWN